MVLIIEVYISLGSFFFFLERSGDMIGGFFFRIFDMVMSYISDYVIVVFFFFGDFLIGENRVVCLGWVGIFLFGIEIRL